MGYLSNSTSFRLGGSVRWSQPGYFPFESYHKGIVRNFQLESYLVQFFERSSFKQLGIIVSHVTIHNMFKKMVIRLHVYHGPIEEMVHAIKQQQQNQKPEVVQDDDSNFMEIVTHESVRINLNNQFQNMFRSLFAKVQDDLSVLTERPVEFTVCTVSGAEINASIINKYVKVRLEQFDSFNEVIFPMARYLNRLTQFSGFLVRCAGRLTRQQRASFHEFQNGMISFNTYSYPLDHSFSVAVLKYGASSVRVWVSRGFLENPAVSLRKGLNSLKNFIIVLGQKYEKNYICAPSKGPDLGYSFGSKSI
jgi:hypothetical protein